MTLRENLKVLGLTPKEKNVLLTLLEGASTPLKLSQQTGVSRPAIYAILKNLHKRGLVVSRITNGHKHWQLDNTHDIDRVIYDTKRALLKIPEGSEEVHGRTDSTIIVHRGKEAIKKMFFGLFENHEQENFSGFQGNIAQIGWDRIFSVPDTNRMNRDIKNNGLIVKAILPSGWFEEQTKLLGIEWAKDFEGRTTRVNEIDPRYFNNGGQIWMFKDSLFLMALNEELVIEIKNSEIQKAIFNVFEFVQDNSRTIDANELLRNLISEKEEAA